MFSVNCDMSVIFPVPSDMVNSNKKKPEKKMCTSGIILTSFNSRSMADASITNAHVRTPPTHGHHIKSISLLICLDLYNKALYYGQQQIILFIEFTEHLGSLFSYQNDEVVLQP